MGNARAVSSAQANAQAAQLAEMSAQVQDMQIAYESMERERGFYFDSALLVCPKWLVVELVSSAKGCYDGGRNWHNEYM